MAEDADLSGVYSCDGVNPAGRPYRGIVEIVKTDNTFHLRWTFPQDADDALGIGIMSNGVLAVSYYGAATAGIVVYKLEEGKLIGDWTVVGAPQNGVYHEVLKRLPGDGTPQLPDDGQDAPSDQAKPQGNPHKLLKG
jgi:hypothetical protein